MTYNISKLDPGGVLKAAFDDSTQALRTTAAPVELAIDAATDSIRIGDGTKLTTTTTVGSQVGLDVNLVGGVVSGNFSQSGLMNGMRTTSIIITDTPSPIPLIPLLNRNTLSARVWGSATVYFGNSSVNALNGYPKKQYEEISMDVKDNAAVELYAVCDTGMTCEVRVIELA